MVLQFLAQTLAISNIMAHPLNFIPFFPLLLSFLFFKLGGENKAFASPYCIPSKPKCGDIEVKYPFWLQSNSSTTTGDQCGYKGFGLRCSPSSSTPPAGDQLVVETRKGDELLYVKNINYLNKTVSLFDIDVTRNESCPWPRHNLTLEEYPLLGYSVLNLSLSLYFNCTGPLNSNSESKQPIFPVGCLKSGKNTSYVSLHTNLQDQGTDYDLGWFKVCEQKVVAPILPLPDTDNYSAVGVNILGRAMNEGFEVGWNAETDCAVCESSGGCCGFNNSGGFLCFCSDGSRITYGHCKAEVEGREIHLGKKIGIGLGASGGTFIICLILFVYHRRQKRKDSGSTLISREISSYDSSLHDPETGLSNYGVQIFEYNELEKATNNFDSERELGDGGFGTVYKGILQDGRDVAVKRLYESNFKRVEQFRNEVLILTRLRHQNLVTLYGCSSRHNRELLLVYEYIPNGTVADHLHGGLARPGSLPWSTRMKIAIETASALAYLHASDVIHRDVKTHNILLDNSFSVKVADFGLSRLFPINATHISTAPQGTPGYVDPEYHECYHLTDKSDVFSFGVVLIELISSMPAVDITRHRHEINLSNMAINKIQSRLLHELVDKNIGFGSDYRIMMMITDIAELAFQCLQFGRDMRPSMEEVLQALMQIQSRDYSPGNAKERDIQADDVKPLNARHLTSSPDSVMEWVSSTTTTSTSS